MDLENASVTLDVDANHASQMVTEDTVNDAVPSGFGEDAKETDPYAYLERDEFCSERWKMELKNLPKQYGFKELKKFLMKLKLNPHKIKKGSNSGYFVFISFRCQEDRDKAISVLNNYKWKNKSLQAYHANAAKDPLIQKRKAVEPGNAEAGDAQQLEPVEVLIKKATIPWFEVPYEEQLDRKNLKLKQYVTDLKGLIRKTNYELKKELGEEWICEDIIPSPVTELYRNKCEFTIGMNPENGLPTVGFRLTSYKKGSKCVGPINGLMHIPNRVREVAIAVENYIRGMEFLPYDPETHNGVWRQLTVRTNLQEQLMLILLFSPKGLDVEKVTELKEKMKNHFSAAVPKILSFYIKAVESQGHHDVTPPELLFGEPVLIEEMCGLKFRISPDSFFQVNTKAAENLIKAIQVHAKLDSDTCLLDICCGTGTLGICLAQYCGQVLGVEIVRSAIDDARINATENSLQEKCEFFCGKAEDIVDALTYHTKKKKIIAILDPPRAGVHTKVLQTLRQSSKVNTVIYVSCDADAAKRNFIDFARPESKKYVGDPFLPKYLIPVDLFPMSPHMELIVVLERVGGNEVIAPAPILKGTAQEVTFQGIDMASRVGKGVSAITLAGRQVKPILSTDKSEARRRVLTLYKAWYRQIPYMVLDYDIPKSVEDCRKKLREEFEKHKNVEDIRVIDILVIKGQMELKETVEIWKQKGHIMDYFRETVEQKPKGFLSKFLSGGE